MANTYFIVTQIGWYILCCCSHQRIHIVLSLSLVGTALEALSSMQCVLRSRPKTFKSFEQATEWWYVANVLFNLI